MLPANDLPVANDDIFAVRGDGPFALNIFQQGSAFDVRANDVAADAYPYDIYGASSIVDVQAVSGGTVSRCWEDLYWASSTMEQESVAHSSS